MDFLHKKVSILGKFLTLLILNVPNFGNQIVVGLIFYTYIFFILKKKID